MLSEEQIRFKYLHCICQVKKTDCELHLKASLAELKILNLKYIIMIFRSYLSTIKFNNQTKLKNVEQKIN